MARLFIGLTLPDAVAQQIYSLRGGLNGASFRPVEKLHLTLNFLGEVNADQTDAIIQELRYLRFPAFYLTAKGVGYFATGDAPHHLWVGVDAPNTLEELHDKVQNALRKAGVDKKDRFGFSPHISIARLRGTSMAEVFEFISHNNLFKSDSFLVENITLFESIARENDEGKYYVQRASFPLSLVEI